MRRIPIFAFVMLVAYNMFSQGDYRNFLVQDNRTHWANVYSLNHPQWNRKQAGIYFDDKGLFDWYEITDENDTISLGDGTDWNINVDHRSFGLYKDTLFVIQWEIEDCCTSRQESYNVVSDTTNAYKIIYVTKKKLVLLELKKDSSYRWVEYMNPSCNELNIREYNCTKKVE